jgi:hypothetical protein
MRDITITREFPIINDYAIMPDLGPGKIPLHIALGLPGVYFDHLTNVTRASAVRRSQAFLKTTPGLTECCEVVPADDISETVKEHTPTYPPYEPGRNPQPQPCGQPPCPKDTLSLVFDILLTPCNCAPEPGTMIMSLVSEGDCYWSGTTWSGQYMAMLSWDSMLCTWVLTILCVRGREWVTIWTGWSSVGPAGTYYRVGNDCPDMAYLTSVTVS